jgi:hypothetical protein
MCSAVQATPTADTAMFYFYTNQLHFTPEFLGRVQLAGSVARLAGAHWGIGLVSCRICASESAASYSGRCLCAVCGASAAGSTER